MKKSLFISVTTLVLGACLPVAAVAQQWEPVPVLKEAATQKPPLASPLTIALAYYKLTARAPNFESWVRQQDAYKNANSFDKPVVEANMVQKLKDAYNALLLTEPLPMEIQAQLSAYDMRNKGFFIENFKASTFFPSSYAGESYAVVPQNITDKKWLGVEDLRVAATIEKAAAANNRLLTMVMFLVPRYADASSPAVIDGVNYWPIAADVKKMMLFQPGDDSPLWLDGPEAINKTHQSILNLYR
jgi:hypothetical protein